MTERPANPTGLSDLTRSSFGRRQFVLGAASAAVLAGCGAAEVSTSDTSVEPASGVTEAAQAVPASTGASFVAAFEGVIRSQGSRQLYEDTVDAYETFDADNAYAETYCLHVVSKKLIGRWLTISEEVQTAEDGVCTVLKRYAQFQEEVESGPCDSQVSQEILNGVMEGEFVVGYADGDQTNRGLMDGKFKWGGAGSEVVGVRSAVMNAGAHHDPLGDLEQCYVAGHNEGTMRGAIVDGEYQGAIVEGALTFDHEETGDGGVFTAVFEGVIRSQGSQTLYDTVVNAYETFDADAIFQDHYCLQVVSKKFNGEWRTMNQEVQTAEDGVCRVLKESVEFQEEVASGPCDSLVSQEILNGLAEGLFVVGYRDGDQTNRGLMDGKFKWGGSGSTVVGVQSAVMNAGTHHDPLGDLEECYVAGHSEGAMRGAIIDGQHQGAIIAGALTFNYDHQW